MNAEAEYEELRREADALRADYEKLLHAMMCAENTLVNGLQPGPSGKLRSAAEATATFLGAHIRNARLSPEERKALAAKMTEQLAEACGPVKS